MISSRKPSRITRIFVFWRQALGMVPLREGCMIKDIKLKLVICTLSMKSRFRFLLTGFFYSFNPLNLDETDGLQHVSALTFDQFRYLGKKNGFSLSRIAYDKIQNSSVLLLLFWPFLWIYTRITKVDFSSHNKIALLIGRILFLKFDKYSLQLKSLSYGTDFSIDSYFSNLYPNTTLAEEKWL